MKKSVAIALVLCMTFMLIACGKSKDVQTVEDAINAIGEVTLESESLIKNAEKLYGILTDSEKSSVSNRLTLVEAREKFDELRMQKVYENSELVYKKLNEVVEICMYGMDVVYDAWSWGIYEADKYKINNASSQTTFIGLALKTGISVGDLEAAGYSADQIKSDWRYAVFTVEGALSKLGYYDAVKQKMSEAQSILQELTTTYGDYTYYPKLKDYYVAVDSYATFFLEPTCSFDQLLDTINNYEKNIRTYQTEVELLLLNKK